MSVDVCQSSDRCLDQHISLHETSFVPTQVSDNLLRQLETDEIYTDEIARHDLIQVHFWHILI